MCEDVKLGSWYWLSGKKPHCLGEIIFHIFMSHHFVIMRFIMHGLVKINLETNLF